MTNRQRISEKLLADLAKVWETHGEPVLKRLAISEPGKLATIAYGLLPRDVFISVTPMLRKLGCRRMAADGRPGEIDQGERT